MVDARALAALKQLTAVAAKKALVLVPDGQSFTPSYERHAAIHIWQGGQGAEQRHGWPLAAAW